MIFDHGKFGECYKITPAFLCLEAEYADWFTPYLAGLSDKTHFYQNTENGC